MTEEEINLLYVLKRKLDAGELTQREFDDAVAIIRGRRKNSEDTNTPKPSQDVSPVKKVIQSKKKGVIIAAIVAVVMLLALGLFLMFHNSSTKSDGQNATETSFPDEIAVQNLIERYCNAICENDFVTLASLYAPMVERFQDAYNKDRDYVIGCHQRYDKKFKVYGKHSSIRWDSFEMRMLNNGQLSVTVVEDYSIDREDKNKYSVFVLEKHFIIDPSYHIVSVYDNQLSKGKGVNLSVDQLAMIAYYYVLIDYAKGSNPIEVGMVYDRVDFRNNVYFRNLVRQVVKSDSDFQTMMNSKVSSTEYMDMAMGKIGYFDIQGSNYSIIFSRYMGEDLSIKVNVNGHEYEWESPDYMNCPLYPTEDENNNNYSKSGLTEDEVLELLIRSEFGDEQATIMLINAIIQELS